jgi:hypothetical protein
MFGTPTLYETEIRRVDAARRRIRRKEEVAARQASVAREVAGRPAAVTPRASRPTRPLPIRVARAVMPGFARRWLRSMMRERAGSPARSASAPPVALASVAAVESESMDLETFVRFSVDDLFYTDTDLDRAMDLLAICRVEAVPTVR